VLLPILRDSGQLPTPFGATILTDGAFGELGPVIAMAVLLGTRGALKSILVLLPFAVMAVGVTFASTRIMPESRLGRLISAGQETTAQITVRLVVLLVITLSLLAAAFQFDIVLGAFAAGFILRRLLPSGHAAPEHKLDGLAFGLLIPVFFVTSGMGIDPAAVAAHPVVLVAFVVAIVVVRGGPVFLATVRQRRPDGAGHQFSRRDSIRVALYASTGLPIIVGGDVGRGLKRSDERDERLAARGPPADDGDPSGARRAERGAVRYACRERVTDHASPGRGRADVAGVVRRRDGAGSGGRGVRRQSHGLRSVTGVLDHLLVHHRAHPQFGRQHAVHLIRIPFDRRRDLLGRAAGPGEPPERGVEVLQLPPAGAGDPRVAVEGKHELVGERVRCAVAAALVVGDGGVSDVERRGRLVGDDDLERDGRLNDLPVVEGHRSRTPGRLGVGRELLGDDDRRHSGRGGGQPKKSAHLMTPLRPGLARGW
jgi:Sodium/hydrogen exchanger family